MVEIVNCGGNLGSLKRCLDRLDIDYKPALSGCELSGGKPVILPGVGSFGSVMERLRNRGFKDRLKEIVAAGTPLLGICIGQQVLFATSEESPEMPGLGLLGGKVVRYRKGKVPQIGWNFVKPREGSGYEPGYAYFVNSYYAVVQNRDVVLYESDYYGPFCAAVQTGNITAFQFHPEKSGEFGHNILRRYFNAL